MSDPITVSGVQLGIVCPHRAPSAVMGCLTVPYPSSPSGVEVPA